MTEPGSIISTAFNLVASADPALMEIVGLSLKVSVSAVAIAGFIGLPLGAMLAVGRFPGRNAATVAVNALMGLPPVVVGLAVYLMISNAGPFGVFQLLYTPTAMIIAQAILVTPIIAALARQTIEDLDLEYSEQLRVLGLSTFERAKTLLYEGRFSLLTAMLAGFGRAIAEVGAVMIVGGNINHVTRTMTTSIALETSKGELALAISLGIVLVSMALAITAFAHSARSVALRL